MLASSMVGVLADVGGVCHSAPRKARVFRLGLRCFIRRKVCPGCRLPIVFSLQITAGMEIAMPMVTKRSPWNHKERIFGIPLLAFYMEIDESSLFHGYKPCASLRVLARILDKWEKT